MSSLHPARVLAFLAAAGLAACGVGSLVSAQAGGGDAATVRFVNATGTSFDLATGGVVTAGNANIVPGAGVACFTVTDPATPALNVRVAGTTAALSGFPAQFAAGGRYLIVAYPGAAGAIQFLSVLANPLVASGRSALRVVQGSSALGPVDVYITAPGAVLGSPIATGLGYGGASASFDVSAGAQHVRLTSTGSTSTVYDTGTQTLAANTGYSLVVSSATAPILVPDC